VKYLFVVHEGKDSDPMDSDTSENDYGDDERKEESEDDDDLFISTASGETKRKEGSQADNAKELYLEEDTETTDLSEDKAAGCPRFQWRTGQHISPPRGKSNRQPSVVKEASDGCFLSPFCRLSSQTALA
jgi:hypothetical protein